MKKLVPMHRIVILISFLVSLGIIQTLVSISNGRISYLEITPFIGVAFIVWALVGRYWWLQTDWGLEWQALQESQHEKKLDAINAFFEPLFETISTYYKLLIGFTILVLLLVGIFGTYYLGDNIFQPPDHYLISSLSESDYDILYIKEFLRTVGVCALAFLLYMAIVAMVLGVIVQAIENNRSLKSSMSDITTMKEGIQGLRSDLSELKKTGESSQVALKWMTHYLKQISEK